MEMKHFLYLIYYMSIFYHVCKERRYNNHSHVFVDYPNLELSITAEFHFNCSFKNVVSELNN